MLHMWPDWSCYVWGAGGQDGVAMSGGSISTDVEGEGGTVAMLAVCVNLCGQYEMLGK